MREGKLFMEDADDEGVEMYIKKYNQYGCERK